MNPALYASFPDSQSARSAIAALIRAGVPADEITLACNTDARQIRASELNPAQDDYPRSEDLSEISSAPPAAERDFNQGIESDRYNETYKEDVERDNVSQEEFGAMPAAFPDLRAAGPGNSPSDLGMGTPGGRLAGIAATANAAENPGQMSDFLWQALPQDQAVYYQRQYDEGKAIVIVRSPDARAEQVLREAGASQIRSNSYLS